MSSFTRQERLSAIERFLQHKDERLLYKPDGDSCDDLPETYAMPDTFFYLDAQEEMLDIYARHATVLFSFALFLPSYYPRLHDDIENVFPHIIHISSPTAGLWENNSLKFPDIMFTHPDNPIEVAGFVCFLSKAPSSLVLCYRTAPLFPRIMDTSLTIRSLERGLFLL